MTSLLPSPVSPLRILARNRRTSATSAVRLLNERDGLFDVLDNSHDFPLCFWSLVTLHGLGLVVPGFTEPLMMLSAVGVGLPVGALLLAH